MVFSSLRFLFLFLPTTYIGYRLIPKRYANTWLLAMSLVFYYAGDRDHLPLLLATIILTYFSGILLSRTNNPSVRKRILFAGVSTLLVLMCYYKYWNFLLENLNTIFHTGLTEKNILFPVGISFFIFQAVSYQVDVYRGEKALKNPVDLALYISFFPQLIAGPIVRFKDISCYLGQQFRQWNPDDFEDGIYRFAIGLSKKVLIANTLGALADLTFDTPDITKYSVLFAWLGAIAYTLQIYYDFSGYSDMAIGLGRIFGFRFQENFNYPYAAVSIRDFWKRWHISLSQFFRDYVYIPLGGNRCSKQRWIFNIITVWFLTGLWHGASRNYVVWGVMYGVLLITETRFFCEKEHSYPRHLLTMILVIVLWVIFRSKTLPDAWIYLKQMAGIGAPSLIDSEAILHLKNFGLLLATASLLAHPVPDILRIMIEQNTRIQILLEIFLMLCTIASVSFIYIGSYNPFLYFMF